MRLIWGLALGAAIALLAGCGGGGGEDTADAGPETPEQVRALDVAMDGWEVPETAGIVMAEQRGGFVDLGLKVSTLSPVSPALSIPDVVAGADEFGVAHLPEVVLAKHRGASLTVVGSLVSQPTATMIWTRNSGIDDVADLEGKTIAIPGLSFQWRFLRTLLSQAGLTLSDVRVDEVGNDLVRALISGRADAIFGGSWNQEGVELERRGLEPVITRVQDLGVPLYDELVLIARADYVSKNPQVARDFLAAVSRGTAEAIESPSGVADALENSVESDPRAGRKMTEVEAETTAPLLSRSGYVNPERVSRLVEWMREEGMVRREISASDLVTNAYLPQP